jgi:hypothetical protein
MEVGINFGRANAGSLTERHSVDYRERKQRLTFVQNAYASPTGWAQAILTGADKIRSRETNHTFSEPTKKETNLRSGRLGASPARLRSKFVLDSYW